MDTLDRYVATLRLAARVYRLIGGRASLTRDGGPDLLELASSREVEARALARPGASADEVPIPLAASLGDWQSADRRDVVVRAIETELLRLAGQLYFGDVPMETKRALETAIATSEGVIASLAPDAESAPSNLAGGLGAVAKGDGDRPHEADGYPVWFATDREPIDPTRPCAGFGRERGRGDVCRGRCVVHVPRSHRIGSLGTNVLLRVLRGGDRRLTLERLEPMPGEAFWRGLDGHVAAASEGHRHAVVFIHGYNVSFEAAALRTAQIGHDLGVRGAMAFFGWPSQGRLHGYFADGDAIAASAPAITDFLVSMATLPSVGAVHVIAHSMGNRGALAAVSRIAADAERMSGRRFGQFILAAADVDADVFRNEAQAYVRLGTRTTLYVSDRDKALATSSRISAYARAGLHPPLSLVEGVDTVDVGDIDLDRLGHGYVGNDRGVLADMHRLIFEGAPPPARFGLESRATPGGDAYWGFRR